MLFSVMMGALSIESCKRVEVHPDWDDIYKPIDPLRLWKRIHNIQAVGGDLSAPIVSRAKAEDNFMSLKQDELKH